MSGRRKVASQRREWNRDRERRREHDLESVIRRTNEGSMVGGQCVQNKVRRRLPLSCALRSGALYISAARPFAGARGIAQHDTARSEERRVGKEC